MVSLVPDLGDRNEFGFSGERRGQEEESKQRAD
jgi:hypothetical protein